LIDVVFLTFAAVLSGASGWKSIQEFGDAQLDWLRQYRDFANGMPRRHCIANIIKALDTDALIQALFGWINSRREQEGKAIIALDGKTLRRTWDEDVHKALHVVSAYDVGAGVALYQQAANSKGKEGELARNIIDMLALDNCIVTMDALHCQTETLKRIVGRKGDYVVQVKANQRNLSRAIRQAFEEAYGTEGLEEYVERSQGHGRKEQRTVMQLPATVLPDPLQSRWPSVCSLIEVASERSADRETHCDSRWYISSLPLDAKQAAGAIRQHWGIESMHWILDVVFREDELSISDPDGAAHVALFNRVALSLIKQHQGKKDSLAGKRRRAAWSPEFRSELIFG
jgi:predicted transposase YbfD/YdcC